MMIEPKRQEEKEPFCELCSYVIPLNDAALQSKGMPLSQLLDEYFNRRAVLYFSYSNCYLGLHSDLQSYSQSNYDVCSGTKPSYTKQSGNIYHPSSPVQSEFGICVGDSRTPVGVPFYCYIRVEEVGFMALIGMWEDRIQSYVTLS